MSTIIIADEKRRNFKGLLSRLRANKAGTTLALMVTGMIPLMAVLGAGIDVGRLYMVQSRMQQACDAGSLATRRAMGGTTPTTADIAEGLKYFDFNMPGDSALLYGSTITRGYTAGSTSGTVSGTASVDLRTTVMDVFGYSSFPVAVACSSRLDVGNSDVMMVLDVTGSMNDTISNGSGGSIRKIDGLKAAVKDFYDTLGTGGTTSRIRYGFVPYDSNVNMGPIIKAISPTHMVGGITNETWNYYSRVANMTTAKHKPTTGSWSALGNTTTFNGGTLISAANCTNYGNNVGFTQSGVTFAPSPSGNPTPPSAELTGGATPAPVVTTNYGNPLRVGSGTNRACTRQSKTATTTYTTSYAFASWTYQQTPYDVSNYVAGNAVSFAPGDITNSERDAMRVTTSGTYNLAALATAAGSTLTRVSSQVWPGCIEERDTLNSITGTNALTIPAAAHDMDIDSAPTSTATKWRPYFPQIAYKADGTWYSNGQCAAAPARKLQTYSSYTGSLQTYVNTLTPGGNTYHDIGMVWGARLLSSTGMLAAENTTAPNGLSISRHIVFMTDGDMYNDAENYDAWGQNKQDGRIAPPNSSSTELISRHNRRLEMLCNAIKGKGITIWVVAFGTSLNTQLSNCANSPQHAAVSTSAADLKTRFRSIAQSIGGLRLAS
jgi:Flp pilus assembly protein TadG